MSTSTANRPSGRAKSCVGCRQFKLACDARRTAPDPCTRCISKGLNCRFDPNFKRISTRKYVVIKFLTAELTSIELLRSMLMGSTHCEPCRTLTARVLPRTRHIQVSSLAVKVRHLKLLLDHRCLHTARSGVHLVIRTSLDGSTLPKTSL